MSDQPDGHTHLEDRAEAVTRGWALLGGILLSMTLPLVWLEREGEADEYGSLWGAVDALFLAGDDSFVAPDSSFDGGLDTGLVLVRLAIGLLVLGLVTAGYQGVNLITRGDLDAVPRWQRLTLGWLLTAAVLLLLAGSGAIDEPENELQLRGIGAGVGSWAVLFTAVAAGASRAAPRWRRPLGHPHG